MTLINFFFLKTTFAWTQNKLFLFLIINKRARETNMFLRNIDLYKKKKKKIDKNTCLNSHAHSLTKKLFILTKSNVDV